MLDFCKTLVLFRKELEFQEVKNEELSRKNSQLTKEVQSLQMQHQVIQNGLQMTNQSLEQSLANERKFRIIAEEDCLQKNKVMIWINVCISINTSTYC